MNNIMESKFTPGPWNAGGKLPYKGNESWIFDSSIPEKLIAKVSPPESGFSISLSESFANAILIAAAPELLEATEMLLSLCKAALGKSPYKNADETIAFAEKAIYKALNQ